MDQAQEPRRLDRLRLVVIEPGRGAALSIGLIVLALLAPARAQTVADSEFVRAVAAELEKYPVASDGPELVLTPGFGSDEPSTAVSSIDGEVSCVGEIPAPGNAVGDGPGDCAHRTSSRYLSLCGGCGSQIRKAVSGVALRRPVGPAFEEGREISLPLWDPHQPKEVVFVDVDMIRLEMIASGVRASVEFASTFDHDIARWSLEVHDAASAYIAGLRLTR